ALRGRSEDYKTLDVELSFSARGALYRAVRNRRGDTLQLLGPAPEAGLSDGDPAVQEGDAPDVVATGASILNQKIPEILGFGLKVFDTTCSCNQGRFEALGSRTPTERRRMVDSVIGLTVIEDLQKWANDEANTNRRNFEAVSSVLV